MNQSHTVEYIVIGLFLAFMVVVGALSRRLVRNFADYFRSGSRATWWLVGSSVFMGSFSAWTFTGAASVAFDSGLAVSVIFITATIAFFSNGFLTAPWFRQLRATTAPEVVHDRFGTVTQQYYLWFGFIPAILMSSLALLAVAVFTSAVFGYKVWLVVVVLGMVVLIYSTLGGSWSVLATDFLQALILMPMALLISILALKSIGGLGGLLHALKEQGLETHLQLIQTTPEAKYTLAWAAAMLTYQLVTSNSLNSAGRYFMCKDGRDAKKAALLCGVLFLLGAVIWFIPPIVARLQFAPQVAAMKGKLPNPSEASYAIISIHLLPKGLAGLVLVSMFSATMSSIVLTLNQAAAIITQDFYKKLLYPQASDRRMFVAGHIASMFVGLLIIEIALYLSLAKTGGLFEWMLDIGSMLGTPMIVPMVLSLFVRKSPTWSAVVSSLAGLAVSYVSWKNKWLYSDTVFEVALVGTIGYLATLPFWDLTSEAYRRKAAAFYEKMERPVDFEKEVGGAIDTRQMRMLGVCAFAIGAFIALLLLLPNPLSGRIQILCLGGFIALLGVAMLVAARIVERRDAARLRARELAQTPVFSPTAESPTIE